MATNIDLLGSELQVNIAPHQNNDQLDPDVTALTDGRFFVVYEDEVAGGNTNIFGAFFNPDGSTAVAEIDVISEADLQDNPSVASRLGGAAVVVYEDDNHSATDPDIYLAVVSSAGVASPELLVANTGDPLTNPDVTMLANGQNPIVFERDLGGGNIDLYLRVLDEAGTGFTAGAFAIPVDTGTSETDDPAIAAFANNALIVYEDDAALAGSNDIVARLYDGTAGTVGAAVVIAGTAASGADHTNPLFDPDVAALSDGRFVIVYEDDNGSNDNIFGRIYNPVTGVLSAEFVISSAGDTQGDVRVAAAPDGGFVAIWEDGSGSLAPDSNGSQAVHARRFDSNGAPVGDEFLVNAGPFENDQDTPALAVNATGGVYFAFEDSDAQPAGDADPDGIRGHAAALVTQTVNGTIGDDIIQTYGLGETINGLTGDDLILAFAGDDIVHGNGGGDLLVGGLGNDQLFGDGGADRLKGEDGRDLLVGGLGGDVLIGGLLRDTFDYNALNESRVGALRDTIKGFSHAEHDKIDLSDIDANTTAGGNQAFHLIGAQAFHGIAGELRFAGGVVQGDINGNGVADFEIRVTGLAAAVNGDFVL